MTAIRKVIPALAGSLALIVASCAPAAAPTSAPVPAAPAAPPAAAPAAPAAPAAAPPAARPPAAPTPTPVRAAVPAAPAAQQPKYGGVLSISIGADPPSMDLHQEVTAAVVHPIGPVYDGLVQIDPQNPAAVIPDLAERWETSKDGLTYTFYLRKGVTWHDGKSLTSADVKYSLDRIRLQPAPMKASPRKATFEPIAGVEAPDDYTVKVTMKRPFPSFMVNMVTAYLSILPKHVIEREGDMRKAVVGTGPFKYAEYTPGVSHKLVKNPNYWNKGTPYLDGLTYHIIVDETSQIAAFRTKRLQVIPRWPPVSPAGVRVLQSLGDQVKLHRNGDFLVLPLFINPSVGVWKDPRVRQALNLAVDRQEANNQLAAGRGFIGGLMPPYGEWAIPQDEVLKRPGYRQPKDQDIAEAKRLLAEARVPKGMKVVVKTHRSAVVRNPSEFLVTQLRRLDIDATLQVLDISKYYEDGLSGNFELIGGGFAIGVDDPDGWFGELYTTKAPRNYPRFSDPKVDELYAKQSQMLDTVERKRVVQEMERLTLDTNVFIVLYWSAYHVALWPEVKGFVSPVGNYTAVKMDRLWIER